ncbi:uncharacterized protein LOC130556512 isoform X2 [Triplophysa rosa]|nr:uncharacterized protein LOC130556512 isoform X2 [Triplophysa rosa]
MKENVDAQLIDQEVLRAKESQMKWSKEGRIINIAEVKKIVKRDASFRDLAEYFEKQGFFITNQESSSKKEVIALAKAEIEDVYKRLVEKKRVASKNQTTFRNYCVATLMYMHNQSPKSIVEFKVQDWNNRRQEGDKVLLQLPKKHTFKLSKTEDMFLDCYFCNIRPGYLKNSYNKKYENFFLTSSGVPLSNPTADVDHLWRKYGSVAQRRGSPTDAMPEEQQSAECISPLSLWFAFEDKFPITLHGKAPTQKQATEAGFVKNRRLYFQWRGVQYKQRVQYVLERFTRETDAKPKPSQIQRIIDTTTWTTNIPTVDDVLLAWIPLARTSPAQIETDVSTRNSVTEQYVEEPATENEKEVENDASEISLVSEQQGEELSIKKEEEVDDIFAMISISKQQWKELAVKKEEDVEDNVSLLNLVTEQQWTELGIKQEEEIMATMEFTANQNQCDHSEIVPKPDAKRRRISQSLHS